MKYRARPLPRRRPVIPTPDVRTGLSTITVRLPMAPRDDAAALEAALRAAGESTDSLQGSELHRHPDGSAVIILHRD